MMTNHLQISLFLLRVSVFLVMLMWTLDKILNPAHAAAVFGAFYSIGGMPASAYTVLGVLELVLIGAFVAGFSKFWSYGAVMVLHAVSTASSFNQYLAPFEPGNLLFFAAWPMLAACVALFLLRDADELWTFGRKQPR